MPLCPRETSILRLGDPAIRALRASLRFAALRCQGRFTRCRATHVAAVGRLGAGRGAAPYWGTGGRRSASTSTALRPRITPGDVEGLKLEGELGTGGHRPWRVGHEEHGDHWTLSSTCGGLGPAAMKRVMGRPHDAVLQFRAIALLLLAALPTACVSPSTHGKHSEACEAARQHAQAATRDYFFVCWPEGLDPRPPER